LRLWTSTAKYKKQSAFKSILVFVTRPMSIVDLLAVLPFYLPMLIPFDMRFLRMFRLTRLFKVLKLNRYSKSLNLVGNVIKNKKYELSITIFI
jgi:voltage-gated potassium channel